MISTSPPKDNLANASVKVRGKKPALLPWLLGAAVALASTLPYWHIVADKLTVTTGNTPALAFGGDENVSKWQKQARLQLLKALHLQPHSTAQAKILSEEKIDQVMFDATVLHLRRVAVRIPSRSGSDIFGYLLLPAQGSDKPLPCIVCVPGHGQGLDHAVGIDSDGLLFKMWDGTPRDFALFFAKRGYAVFCYEQYGIGHRSATGNNAKLEKFECLVSDAKARYTGESTLGWRIDDALRALDFVSARPEIDPKRVAMMGLSAGGTTTMYTAALDERVKCAVVVSAFCTYADSTFRQAECVCNYAPGLPALASSGDVAGLIAPRGLIIESGTVDDRFPARSAIVEFEKVKRIYGLVGAPDMAELDVEEHGHRCFYGLKTDAFLKKYL